MIRFKIKMHLSIGYQGSHNEEDYFEVPDNATPKEIEEEAERFTNEWADNYIDLGYTYTKEQPDKEAGKQ